MNYQEALQYLDELNVFGSKLGLVRIQRLTQLLGLPQNYYKTIHVTGTNGKGSVSAMLRYVLTEAGLKTGLYTSPHLVDYTERMSIDGVEISQSDFASVLNKVKSAVKKMLSEGEESPTQFEVLTAMAFLYFFEQKVDYAVIEVGLGGLLDSTNVIIPEVTVITNVAFEHADKCGGTLEGIANHKAGILKEGRPLVTAADGLAGEIIIEKAKAINAPVYRFNIDFNCKSLKYDTEGQSFKYCFKASDSVEFKINLLGTHQLINASLVITVARLLSEKEKTITSEVIQKALSKAEWPGRFEVLRICDKAILIDGAHNPAGMKTLRCGLDEYFPGKKRVFLLGILADKAIDEMLEILLRQEDVVVITPPDSERAADVQDLASRVKGARVYIEADNAKALQKAFGMTLDDGLLCCAGSLYLIGGIRDMLLKGAVCGKE